MPCAHGKLNVKHHRTAPKPEIHTYITVEKAEEAALARKQSTKTNTKDTAAAVRVCMYTSEADFNKPGIFGRSVRVWATAWDVFRRAQPRVGRGGRTAVDFVVCFGLGGFWMRQKPRERSDRGRFLPLGKKVSSYRGAYRVPLFSVCMCNIRRLY